MAFKNPDFCNKKEEKEKGMAQISYKEAEDYFEKYLNFVNINIP